MLICKLPVGVRKVGDLYKSLYSATGVGFAEMTALFCYFIFGCDSLSGLCRILVQSPSHSELSRAVAEFPGNRFLRRCRRSILRKYAGQLDPEDFTFAIDDTENPRYGAKIFGCGRWAQKHKSFFGQKILLLALVDIRRNIAIPIDYAFLSNRNDPNYKSAVEHALSMIDSCLEEGFPRLQVVADSWFDSGDLMKELKARSMTLVVEIKSSRKVRTSTGQWVRYQSLPETFTSPTSEVYARPLSKKTVGRPCLRFIESKVLQLRTFRSPVKVVAVFNKRTSKKAFGYYVSTDRAMPGARVWTLFRARWAIEVLFRDLKQNLSFGTLPCQGKNASDLAVCLPLILVTSLRIRPEIWGMKEGLTIGEMVKRIRTQALDQSIVALALPNAGELRERVRSRRSLERVGRKPVNRTAA